MNDEPATPTGESLR